MPHGRCSCQDHGVAALHTELARLYARRLRLDSTIRELEFVKRFIDPARDANPPSNSLEFSSKPCNLTSCRSA